MCWLCVQPALLCSYGCCGCSPPRSDIQGEDDCASPTKPPPGDSVVASVVLSDGGGTATGDADAAVGAATVGAFPPSAPATGSPVQTDATQRLIELEKQRKARREEILAKRKEALVAARAAACVDGSGGGAGGDVAAGTGVAAPGSGGAAAAATPSATPAKAAAPAPDASSLRMQRLAYYQAQQKAGSDAPPATTSATATASATALTASSAMTGSSGDPAVRSPSEAEALTPSPLLDQQQQQQHPQQQQQQAAQKQAAVKRSPIRQTGKGAGEGEPAKAVAASSSSSSLAHSHSQGRVKAAESEAVPAPPSATTPVPVAALSKRVIEAKRVEDMNDDELEVMLMAPRPGYNDDNENSGADDDGDDDGSGGDDPKRQSAAKKGSSVSGGGAGGEPVGLPRMFPTTKQSKAAATAAAYGHPVPAAPKPKRGTHSSGPRPGGGLFSVFSSRHMDAPAMPPVMRGVRSLLNRSRGELGLSADPGFSAEGEEHDADVGLLAPAQLESQQQPPQQQPQAVLAASYGSEYDDGADEESRRTGDGSGLPRGGRRRRQRQRLRHSRSRGEGIELMSGIRALPRDHDSSPIRVPGGGSAGGSHTMSKADRLDPMAIVKRYEMRAEMDRLRRLQQSVVSGGASGGASAQAGSSVSGDSDDGNDEPEVTAPGPTSASGQPHSSGAASASTAAVAVASDRHRNAAVRGGRHGDDEVNNNAVDDDDDDDEHGYSDDAFVADEGSLSARPATASVAVHASSRGGGAGGVGAAAASGLPTAVVTPRLRVSRPMSAAATTTAPIATARSDYSDNFDSDDENGVGASGRDHAGGASRVMTTASADGDRSGNKVSQTRPPRPAALQTRGVAAASTGRTDGGVNSGVVPSPVSSKPTTPLLVPSSLQRPQQTATVPSAAPSSVAAAASGKPHASPVTGASSGQSLSAAPSLSSLPVLVGSSGPPDLLASLMESAKHDSATQLRMALRSFTQAWTGDSTGSGGVVPGAAPGPLPGAGPTVVPPGRGGKDGRKGKARRESGGRNKDTRRVSGSGDTAGLAGDASFFADAGGDGDGEGDGGVEVGAAQAAPLDWMIGDDGDVGHVKGRKRQPRSGGPQHSSPQQHQLQQRQQAQRQQAQQQQQQQQQPQPQHHHPERAASWVGKDGKLPKMGGFENDTVDAPSHTMLRRAYTFSQG